MAKDKLKIATCQFAVGHSIRRNAQSICNYMRKAHQNRAEIVHFSECALSGYAGVDHQSLANLDWGLLEEKTQEIMALAKKLKLWVVLGSTHRLSGQNKPHNCLYLINPNGQIADRYDKRFCMERDLQNYCPGNHTVTFTINGILCSLLICFDLRFPEIYRHLKKQNVQCIFQSFYNARQTEPSIHTHIMRQTMQCRAASNFFWVSMANSSAYYSPYPSCLIRPDGKIISQLPFHRAALAVNTINLNIDLYDPMTPFRPLAMRGQLHTGKLIKDPRSQNRTAL